MNWINKNKLIIIGTFIGTVAGFSYYYFIGCSSGERCVITSNPLNSTLYGSLLGFLIFSTLQKK